MSTKTYQIKPFEWRYDDEIETHISLNNYRVMRRSDGQHVAFWNGWLVECDSIDHGKQLAEAHHRAELEKHLIEVPDSSVPQIPDSELPTVEDVQAIYKATACSCRKCQAATGRVGFAPMIVCETCGNKRCPHATDHTLPCTNSNEPGQPGSIYT